jgi:hypothetical protein
MNNPLSIGNSGGVLSSGGGGPESLPDGCASIGALYSISANINMTTIWGRI